MEQLNFSLMKFEIPCVVVTVLKSKLRYVNITKALLLQYFYYCSFNDVLGNEMFCGMIAQ